jgi:hypothetical protein
MHSAADSVSADALVATAWRLLITRAIGAGVRLLWIVCEQ